MRLQQNQVEQFPIFNVICIMPLRRLRCSAWRYVMRRILLLLPLALLLIALVPVFSQTSPAASLGQGPARVTQVDTSHYPDVTLYVGVTGTDGKPVGGLS